MEQKVSQKMNLQFGEVISVVIKGVFPAPAVLLQAILDWSGSVSANVRVNPGLFCTELGQLFDTRWLDLNRNVYPVLPHRYIDR